MRSNPLVFPSCIISEPLFLDTFRLGFVPLMWVCMCVQTSNQWKYVYAWIYVVTRGKKASIKCYIVLSSVLNAISLFFLMIISLVFLFLILTMFFFSQLMTCYLILILLFCYSIILLFCQSFSFYSKKCFFFLLWLFSFCKMAAFQGKKSGDQCRHHAIRLTG